MSHSRQLAQQELVCLHNHLTHTWEVFNPSVVSIAHWDRRALQQAAHSLVSTLFNPCLRRRRVSAGSSCPAPCLFCDTVRPSAAVSCAGTGP